MITMCLSILSNIFLSKTLLLFGQWRRVFVHPSVTEKFPDEHRVNKKKIDFTNVNKHFSLYRYTGFLPACKPSNLRVVRSSLLFVRFNLSYSSEFWRLHEAMLLVFLWHICFRKVRVDRKLPSVILWRNSCRSCQS